MRKSHDRSAGKGATDRARAERHDEPLLGTDLGAGPDAPRDAAGGEPLDAEEARGADAAASLSVDAESVVAATADEREDLERELEMQRDKYLRLAAEFDNFRRRTQKERSEAGARAQAELVRQLIDALDDLDRFAQVDPATATAQSVLDGVGMVGRKLAKALGAAGLEIVNPEGEPFDPARHEAVATAPAAAREEDSTVAQVYQLGYVFGGQLLRPARVVVRQWNG